MALYTVSAGAAILAADLNQYYNLLTGAIHDQGVTLGYVGANSERLITGNVALTLTRGAVASTSTGLMLVSSSGGSINQGMMLAPGSEDLIFGYDNGVSFSEQLRIKASQAQGLWQTGTAAAPPSASSFAGGLRLSLYDTPANDAAAFGFGIAANELWANVPTGSAFVARVAGLKSIQANASGFGVFNSSGTLTWFVSTTNSTSDPGSPWMRTDGNILVINPRVAADLYLMWDGSTSVGTTHIGQNANTIVKVGEGTGTLYAGIGNITTINATNINLPNVGSVFSNSGGSGFIIDRGSFSRTYAGGNDNSTYATNLNFNGRTPTIVASCTNQAAATACNFDVTISGNTISLLISSGDNRSYNFNWVAVG